MEIRISSNIEELRDDWLSLQSIGKSYVFQSYQWVAHWLQTAGKLQGVEPFVVSVRQAVDNAPFLIIPLALQSIRGVRHLTALGGFHADYAGAVLRGDLAASYSPERVRETIVARAKQSGVDLIWVRNIPQFIEEVPNPLYRSGSAPSDLALSASLDESWDKFYSSHVKSRIRADSRRQTRRLSDLGQLRFRIAEDEQETRRLTEVMIAQKQARYNVKNIKDQFTGKGNRDFYLGAEQGGSPPCGVQVSALLLDDKVLAVHWGAVRDGRFYYLMPSHDSQWESYSPGRLLLEHLMQWSFANGLRVFDFTNGEEPYKMEWANVKTPLYEYRQPLTLKGRMYAVAADAYKNRLRGKWKSILQRVAK